MSGMENVPASASVCCEQAADGACESAPVCAARETGEPMSASVRATKEAAEVPTNLPHVETSNPSIKIVVAAHKPYWMPADQMYVPVQVGAACDGRRDSIPGFKRDDGGDNISLKNPCYCELTALYWAWHNLNADYVGLAHYRRHFKGCGERNTLTFDEARLLLKKAPVILPKKRNYYIETNHSHYSNTFDRAHIDAVKSAISNISPEYLSEFEQQLRSTRAHMFNMVIMRRDLLGSYCTWLFSVLKTTEQAINFDNLTPFETRCIGRLSELLLDVWISHNSVEYVECPVVSMERVNWAKKGSAFLAAKFLGRKYKESF